MKWYLKLDNKIYGPHDVDEIVKYVFFTKSIHHAFVRQETSNRFIPFESSSLGSQSTLQSLVRSRDLALKYNFSFDFLTLFSVIGIIACIYIKFENEFLAFSGLLGCLLAFIRPEKSLFPLGQVYPLREYLDPEFIREREKAIIRERQDEDQRRRSQQLKDAAEADRRQREAFEAEKRQTAENERKAQVNTYYSEFMMTYKNLQLRHFKIDNADYARNNRKDRNFERKFRSRLETYFEYSCFKCKTRAQSLHLDHFFFAKNQGGCFIMHLENGTKLFNAIPLCGSCNGSKGQRSYEVFLTLEQQKEAIYALKKFNAEINK